MPVRALTGSTLDDYLTGGNTVDNIGEAAGTLPQGPLLTTLGNLGASRARALTTRGSWYSQLPQYGWIDRGDRPGSNALGVPDARQGIALPTRKTLGQWFNVTSPTGESYRLQQTDVGPAKWTGRGVDISAAAAHQMGYTPKTFPTDANFTVVPADGPPPGWNASVGASGEGVGYTNPALSAQGATTNPALLQRAPETGFSLGRFLQNFDFTPAKVPAAAPTGLAAMPAFRFAPLGQRR